MKRERLKVFIRCQQCGERFILRGSKGGKGKLGTGFKQCLCDNKENFELRTEDL
jgi:hypothetical protein